MGIAPDIYNELINFSPDILGISAYTQDVYTVKSILEKVKKFNKNILTVVGGHHSSLFPKDFSWGVVDIVVIGEGQEIFSEIVETYISKKDLTSISNIAIWKNGKLNLSGKKQPNNFDNIKIPLRNLTKSYRNKYFRGKW